MKNKTNVKYLPHDITKCDTTCTWHKKHSKEGHVYTPDEVFPKNVCPILYHTLYPYFLGAMYGAKYSYNDKGDCQVCCPAVKSVDLIVKTRPNDGSYGDMATSDRKKVFFAEVVKVNGDCPYSHKVGEKIIFPLTNREEYVCSAGVNNIFPFLNIDIPSCIDTKRLRCPDWKENVYYSIEADSPTDQIEADSPTDQK